MGELRMLIGGQLVDAEGGKTFDNVNPATEEVLGPVADGSAADMQRAVDAARTAFDTTDWSTDHAGRKRCLLAAPGGDRGRGRGAPLRAGRRGRLPGAPHLRAAARRAAKEALRWPAR